MPHLNCREGDIVYIRATVLSACSDAFQVRIEDYPNLVITTWAPAREIAKAEDIHLLKAMHRWDLSHQDPHYNGVNAQKLPK